MKEMKIGRRVLDSIEEAPLTWLEPHVHTGPFVSSQIKLKSLKAHWTSRQLLAYSKHCWGLTSKFMIGKLLVLLRVGCVGCVVCAGEEDKGICAKIFGNVISDGGISLIPFEGKLSVNLIS